MLTSTLLSPENKQRLAHELEQAANRYHIVGLWIAAVFDPLFGVTDYINIPHAWKQVFVIRLIVTLLAFGLLLLRKKYNYPSFLGVYIAFFAISLQNAYTYSLIDVKDFLGHTLNYIALFLGTAMFVLWRWQYSVAAIAASALSCILFFNQNHKLALHTALVEGGLLLVVMAVFTVLLIQTRYNLTVKTILARMALADANSALNEQKELVEAKNMALSEQKELVEAKNAKILDSIKYAQRIQNAILPSLDTIKTVLPYSFVFFKPKDIVSGDFYYFNQIGDKIVMAAVDCTGHGVPGAFMSMIGYEILNEILYVWKIDLANEVLYHLNLNIRKSLKQEETQNKDGMDIALCVIDKANQTVQYAGAKNPLLYIQNKEMIEVKADKIPIGGDYKGNEERKFTNHLIPLVATPTMFYLFTDGFQDQFGGEEGKKYSIKRMKTLFLAVYQQEMDTQRETIATTLHQWQGKEKQIDDVLVMGFEV